MEENSSKPEPLRKRSDFLRVQNHGKRFKDNAMLLLIDRGVETKTRVGYTISRKVGNAVVRNRVRRRMREVIRNHRDVLNPGYDHVIIAFPRAARLTFANLQEELLCLLNKAHAWASAKPSSSP